MNTTTTSRWLKTLLISLIISLTVISAWPRAMAAKEIITPEGIHLFVDDPSECSASKEACEGYAKAMKEYDSWPAFDKKYFAPPVMPTPPPLAKNESGGRSFWDFVTNPGGTLADTASFFVGAVAAVVGDIPVLKDIAAITQGITNMVGKMAKTTSTFATDFSKATIAGDTAKMGKLTGEVGVAAGEVGKTMVVDPYVNAYKSTSTFISHAADGTLSWDDTRAFAYDMAVAVQTTAMIAGPVMPAGNFAIAAACVGVGGAATQAALDIQENPTAQTAMLGALNVGLAMADVKDAKTAAAQKGFQEKLVENGMKSVDEALEVKLKDEAFEKITTEAAEKKAKEAALKAQEEGVSELISKDQQAALRKESTAKLMPAGAKRDAALKEAADLKAKAFTPDELAKREANEKALKDKMEQQAKADAEAELLVEKKAALQEKEAMLDKEVEWAKDPGHNTPAETERKLKKLQTERDALAAEQKTLAEAEKKFVEAANKNKTLVTRLKDSYTDLKDAYTDWSLKGDIKSKASRDALVADQLPQAAAIEKLAQGKIDHNAQLALDEAMKGELELAARQNTSLLKQYFPDDMTEEGIKTRVREKLKNSITTDAKIAATGAFAPLRTANKKGKDELKAKKAKLLKECADPACKQEKAKAAEKKAEMDRLTQELSAVGNEQKLQANASYKQGRERERSEQELEAKQKQAAERAQQRAEARAKQQEEDLARQRAGYLSQAQQQAIKDVSQAQRAQGQTLEALLQARSKAQAELDQEQGAAEQAQTQLVQTRIAAQAQQAQAEAQTRQAQNIQEQAQARQSRLDQQERSSEAWNEKAAPRPEPIALGGPDDPKGPANEAAATSAVQSYFRQKVEEDARVKIYEGMVANNKNKLSFADRDKIKAEVEKTLREQAAAFDQLAASMADAAMQDGTLKARVITQVNAGKRIADDDHQIIVTTLDNIYQGSLDGTLTDTEPATMEAVFCAQIENAAVADARKKTGNTLDDKQKAALKQEAQSAFQTIMADPDSNARMTAQLRTGKPISDDPLLAGLLDTASGKTLADKITAVKNVVAYTPLWQEFETNMLQAAAAGAKNGVVPDALKQSIKAQAQAAAATVLENPTLSARVLNLNLSTGDHAAGEDGAIARMLEGAAYSAFNAGKSGAPQLEVDMQKLMLAAKADIGRERLQQELETKMLQAAEIEAKKNKGVVPEALKQSIKAQAEAAAKAAAQDEALKTPLSKLVDGTANFDDAPFDAMLKEAGKLATAAEKQGDTTVALNGLVDVAHDSLWQDALRQAIAAKIGDAAAADALAAAAYRDAEVQKRLRATVGLSFDASKVTRDAFLADIVSAADANRRAPGLLVDAAKDLYAQNKLEQELKAQMMQAATEAGNVDSTLKTQIAANAKAAAEQAMQDKAFKERARALELETETGLYALGDDPLLTTLIGEAKNAATTAAQNHSALALTEIIETTKDAYAKDVLRQTIETQMRQAAAQATTDGVVNDALRQSFAQQAQAGADAIFQDPALKKHVRALNLEDGQHAVNDDALIGSMIDGAVIAAGAAENMNAKALDVSGAMEAGKDAFVQDVVQQAFEGQMLQTAAKNGVVSAALKQSIAEQAAAAAEEAVQYKMVSANVIDLVQAADHLSAEALRAGEVVFGPLLKGGETAVQAALRDKSPLEVDIDGTMLNVTKSVAQNELFQEMVSAIPEGNDATLYRMKIEEKKTLAQKTADAIFQDSLMSERLLERAYDSATLAGDVVFDAMLKTAAPDGKDANAIYTAGRDALIKDTFAQEAAAKMLQTAAQTSPNGVVPETVKQDIAQLASDSAAYLMRDQTLYGRMQYDADGNFDERMRAAFDDGAAKKVADKLAQGLPVYDGERNGNDIQGITMTAKNTLSQDEMRQQIATQMLQAAAKAAPKGVVPEALQQSIAQQAQALTQAVWQAPALERYARVELHLYDQQKTLQDNDIFASMLDTAAKAAADAAKNGGQTVAVNVNGVIVAAQDVLVAKTLGQELEAEMLQTVAKKMPSGVVPDAVKQSIAQQAQAAAQAALQNDPTLQARLLPRLEAFLPVSYDEGFRASAEFAGLLKATQGITQAAVAQAALQKELETQMLQYAKTSAGGPLSAALQQSITQQAQAAAQTALQSDWVQARVLAEVNAGKPFSEDAVFASLINGAITAATTAAKNRATVGKLDASSMASDTAAKNALQQALFDEMRQAAIDGSNTGGRGGSLSGDLVASLQKTAQEAAAAALRDQTSNQALAANLPDKALQARLLAQLNAGKALGDDPIFGAIMDKLDAAAADAGKFGASKVNVYINNTVYAVQNAAAQEAAAKEAAAKEAAAKEAAAQEAAAKEAAAKEAAAKEAAAKEAAAKEAAAQEAVAAKEAADRAAAMQATAEWQDQYAKTQKAVQVTLNEAIYTGRMSDKSSILAGVAVANNLESQKAAAIAQIMAAAEKADPKFFERVSAKGALVIESDPFLTPIMTKISQAVTAAAKTGQASLDLAKIINDAVAQQSQTASNALATWEKSVTGAYMAFGAFGAKQGALTSGSVTTGGLSSTTGGNTGGGNTNGGSPTGGSMTGVGGNASSDLSMGWTGVNGSGNSLPPPRIIHVEGQILN